MRSPVPKAPWNWTICEPRVHLTGAWLEHVGEVLRNNRNTKTRKYEKSKKDNRGAERDVLGRWCCQSRTPSAASQGRGRTIATVEALGDRASRKSECETCCGAEL